MEFSSVFFLWVFLPAALAVYYLARLARRGGVAAGNAALLLASLFFYCAGGVKALLAVLCLIAVNYAAGLWIERRGEREPGRGRLAIIAAVLANLLVLAFYKYAPMLVDLAEILLGAARGSLPEPLGLMLLKLEGTGELHIRTLAMPLALSFIVFQSISYLVDVYCRRVRAERDPFLFSLYILLFCQLMQGPIMRFGDLGPQLRARNHSAERFASGIRRFCYGLGKKMIIANALAAPVDLIWESDLANLGAGAAWLGVLLYALQIYYDFSGYTDMAIGVGRMFGFEIAENFDYPYTSLSVREFWRRWHISLSSWFRDYVYIPLGGNRKGRGRTLFNLFVVFLATGIWHGANWNFVAWGLLFALVLIGERLFLGDWLARNPFKVLNWLYAMFVVGMGWVLFRAPNLYVAGQYFRAMFSFRSTVYSLPALSYLNLEVWIALLAGVPLTGLVQRPLRERVEALRRRPLFEACEVILQFAILVWAIALAVSGSYNPSIYATF